MDFLDTYEEWADAHVFFDTAPTSSGPGGTPGDPLAEQSQAWAGRMTDETPNGHLLRRNALFDSLRGGRTLHLLHVTHALEQITASGVLQPSGGCLVGSVYCAPLVATGSGLRMHNLGAYVLGREAPAFLSRTGTPGRTAVPLIIEVQLPEQAYRGLAGVDYLRLGAIHLQIYRRLEYLLSKAERHRLRESVVSRAKNSTAFLSLAAAVAFEGARVEPDRFLRLLHETVPRLPILGYLYFEALAEYLMLHSASLWTTRLAGVGEFNNWLYKEMLSNSSPHATGKFEPAAFRPAPWEIDGLLARIDTTVDTAHARTYLTERISHLVAARLFTPGRGPQVWRHERWEFDSLTRHLGPLLGHLIHRELRSFGRYPDFYFYYDQHKALQAWNYWNHMDIVVPFNGTFPKGEVGINPAYPDLRYRIWRADQDSAGLLHPAAELPITIAPRLVDIKHTLMRSSALAEPAAPAVAPAPV
jgi:hypothetical protein